MDNEVDVKISGHLKEFIPNEHVEFIAALKNKSKYENCMTEYLKMSGIYWSVTSLHLLNRSEKVDTASIMEFVIQCWKEKGGFAASPRMDAHLLYTLSAVQIACILGKESCLPVGEISDYVKGLQNKDGSFCGDKWGELDCKFIFCAVATLSLLGRLNDINVDKAVEYVIQCQNFDGAFGLRPGCESHAGMTYCCVGVLYATGNIGLVDADKLGYWLCERQLPSGGLNGRPDKLPDVCYSWWVYATAHMIGRQHWIQEDRLKKFILACQDAEVGGFSDRPGNVTDPFHTLFGIAGLSLMNHMGIEAVDCCYCMPKSVIQRLGLYNAQKGVLLRGCESTLLDLRKVKMFEREDRDRRGINTLMSQQPMEWDA